MYNAFVPHDGRDGNLVFHDKLLADGVKLKKFVRIEPMLINNGGVFVDNTGWIDVLYDRELDCRTVFFCNAGTSFILSGREAKDLLDTNKIREYIRDQALYIYGSPVELLHKVIFLPLLFSKLTDMSMDQEQKKNKAIN